MAKFIINIKETYIYEIEIDAETKAEAIKKSKKIYDTTPDGWRFTADANSHVKTTFNVKDKN